MIAVARLYLESMKAGGVADYPNVRHQKALPAGRSGHQPVRRMCAKMQSLGARPGIPDDVQSILAAYRAMYLPLCGRAS